MVNFPGSLDSLSNPGPTTKRNDPGFSLAGKISDLNDIGEGLEAKVGISESSAQDTPLANTVLLSLTNAKSKWAQVDAAQIKPGTATMLKIAEVTVSGSPAGTIDFTNIPQTYRHLMIVLSSRNDTGAQSIVLRFSSDGTTFDAGSNYDSQYASGSAAVASATEALGSSAAFVGAHAAASNVMCPAVMYFPDYANATHHKTLVSDAASKSGTSSGNLVRHSFGAFWRNTAAIAGIRLLPAANNFAVGSRATLYGLPS